MDAHISAPWVRPEHVSFEGRADVSLDGESIEHGLVTLTSRKLLIRPDTERSCCPDVEVPLEAITHAHLVGLRRRLELNVGDVHHLVLRGADVSRMHGTLADLLGAFAIQ